MYSFKKLSAVTLAATAILGTVAAPAERCSPGSARVNSGCCSQAIKDRVRKGSRQRWSGDIEEQSELAGKRGAKISRLTEFK